MNGTTDCYVNITVDASDELSSDQLENLKKELILAFTYQFNHRNHSVFDIRLLHKHPFEGTQCTYITTSYYVTLS